MNHPLAAPSGMVESTSLQAKRSDDGFQYGGRVEFTTHVGCEQDGSIVVWPLKANSFEATANTLDL